MIDIKCSWGFVMIRDDTKKKKKRWKKYQNVVLLLVKILSSFFIQIPCSLLLIQLNNSWHNTFQLCAEEPPGDCTPPVFTNYISLGQVQIVYWHISGDNDPVSPAFINSIYIYLFYKTLLFFFPFPKYCFSLCKTIRTWKQRCPRAKS